MILFIQMPMIYAIVLGAVFLVLQAVVDNINIDEKDKPKEASNISSEV